MDGPDTSAFYDELADDYELIFECWEDSMQRQGAAIAMLITRYLPGHGAGLRILDAAAGIGTQSLPLAQLGFRVTSRDISARSIARLQREASQRALGIDAGIDDMRALACSPPATFDVVLAFDNALPHLLSDDDLRAAFRSLHAALRPGGIALFSVRDYERIVARVDSVHAYGVRWRNGSRYLPLQVWHWISATHYDVSFYLIADEAGDTARVGRTTARYYAVPTGRLLVLLAEAGFIECERLDDGFYQPVLVARRRSS